MKIGIMQPYFFPYIGYFQLIDAVDKYVNLDHVNFIKRGYMTRNKLTNNIKISVPIQSPSQNKTCIESYLAVDDQHIKKLKKTIKLLYSKEPQFSKIYDLLFTNTLIWSKETNISQLNLHFIKIVCKYLDIQTEFIDSSKGLTSQKREKGLKDIVHKFKGKEYVNAIGGNKIYKSNDFLESKISLKFLKMGNLDIIDPYLSILDLLFKYEKHYIIKQLKNYTLV